MTQKSFSLPHSPHRASTFLVNEIRVNNFPCLAFCLTPPFPSFSFLVFIFFYFHPHSFFFDHEKHMRARVIEILSGQKRRRRWKRNNNAWRSEGKSRGWKVNYGCMRIASFLFHQVLRDSQLENFQFSVFMCVCLTYKRKKIVILPLAVERVCVWFLYVRWVIMESSLSEFSNSFFSSTYINFSLAHIRRRQRREDFSASDFHIFWE